MEEAFLLKRLIHSAPAAGFLLATWLATAVAHAQGDTAPVAETETEAAPSGIFQIIFSGGIVGLAILLLLLALSLLAAYLIFDHLMTIRQSTLMPPGLGEAVHKLLSEGKLGEAQKTCREEPSVLSFVLLAGMGEAEAGWQAVEKAMEDAVAEQAARLFRKIEYLAVIGNLAPMVGLLGTVTGMIFAFQQVASTQGAAGAGQLAEGIYQALVTTVGGLIIAIPALGAFAVFRNRVDQLIAEAAYLSQHALRPLKRVRIRNQPPPPPPA